MNGLKSSLDVICAALNLCEAQAEQLFDCIAAADRAYAIHIYGYDKDNYIPEPLVKRLADLQYLYFLKRALEHDVDEHPELIQSVENLLKNRVKSIANKHS